MILVQRTHPKGELWDRTSTQVYCLYEDDKQYHAYDESNGQWTRRRFDKQTWKILKRNQRL